MKKWFILINFFIISISNLLGYAYGNGNLTIGSCGNHPVGGRATLYFHPSIPFNPNINQYITVRVVLKLGPTTNRIAGIMLVNGAGNLLTNDGWIITQDPNYNIPPYNYNEKHNIPESTEFIWVLRAPATAGNRRLRAKLFYGDVGAKSKEATPIDINVISASILESEIISHNQLQILVPTIITSNHKFNTRNKSVGDYFEIYNSSGNLVLAKIPITNKSQLSVDISKLNAGIYFIALYSREKTVLQKFIKIN